MPMISSYIVQKGDTLMGICMKFYSDPYMYSDIAKYNNIIDPNKICVGQLIKFPRPVNDPQTVVIPVEPTQKCLDAIAGLFQEGFCDGRIERDIYAVIVSSALNQ